MRTTKIRIRNLFGITEIELDDRSVEITGANGAGKTSVIDAIRYALTNKSDRNIIVRKGETEGEILIETDTGLSIDRRKRTEQADYKSVKENGREIMAPGEVPDWVDYGQNILQVLSDLQSENGDWFKARQDVNRDIRNKQAFIADISKDIPAEYNADKWETYDLGDAYRKLTEAKEHNNRIERAKIFRSSYDAKIRKLEADKMITVTSEEQAIAKERERITADIERMKAEIRAAEDKLSGLGARLEDRKAVAESTFQAARAKLDADMGAADEYIGQEPVDCSEMQSAIDNAEAMKAHLSEYKRMKAMQAELEELSRKSMEYTRKIELARTLPGEILSTATIPIEDFTVENGIPLVHGLPVGNLSEGEQLSLCVDVTLAKPNGLQIILIDGTEKLSTENREKLYERCREKGVQFIATRTTDDSIMEVNCL